MFPFMLLPITGKERERKKKKQTQCAKKFGKWQHECRILQCWACEPHIKPVPKQDVAVSNIPFLPHPRTISLAIWAMNYIKKQQSNCGEKDCIHFNKQQAYVSFISLYEMDRKVFQFEQAVQQRPTTPTTPLTVVSLQWQKQSYCLLVIPKTSRLI